VTWWREILGALWLFLPAFVANMSPVFTSKLIPKWNTPIDFGAVHADGERALGNGKTWRGLLGASIAAGITALLMGLYPLPFVDHLDFGYQAGTPTWALFMFGFMLGFAALAGDAMESYAKRRLGKPRGAPWFPFDQLDFVVAGLAAAFAFYPLLQGNWAIEHFGTFWVLGTLIIGTPALHLTVNRVGYWLKLKDVPW
jgi:CDP-2,3-bis-(O-geranylgeranyl)-sn-glycerol synthase